MKRTVIAVDLAKNVFEVAVSTKGGRVAERHRLSRAAFVRFIGQRKPSIFVMEACGTASYWARKLIELGHQPVLLPPQYVAPYRRGNKTDRTDCKALLEAYRNEDIRPVPPKTPAQQTLVALHRLRSAWMAARTARINTLRGLLRELGINIPAGAANVVPRVWEILEDADSPIAEVLRPPIAEACLEIRDFEARTKAIETQLRILAKEMPVVAQLQSIPGIGLLTATGLVAFVGDIQRFPTGRHFASYLGLTPRERSSGQVRRIGRISKRGDVYLRTLLIHGARSVLLGAARTGQPDRLRSWALQLRQRTGHNKAATAVANKLARIAWAVWKRNGSYKTQPAAA